MKIIAQWLLKIVALLVVTSTTSLAQTVDMKALADTLKQGGYVIVFRHGATNRDQADTDPLNHDNVSKQRLLSEGGKAVATQVGAAFKTLQVPIGKVYTGKNTLLVTHKPNILDAFGKDWFEVKEGEATIFRPDGAGKAVPIARVQAS